MPSGTARARFAAAVALLSAAAVLPFLPFAIWDGRALHYGLYGSYQHVMKTFVWTSTSWVQHTIGTTGLLLSQGWAGLVEIVQVAVMLALYAAIALAIRGGRRPLPWMALALFVFSMTTLWPVIYLYFDVCLLLVFGALAETRGSANPQHRANVDQPRRRRPRRGRGRRGDRDPDGWRDRRGNHRSAPLPVRRFLERRT